MMVDNYMKVCLIYPQFEILGGAETQVINLAKFLKTQGHDVTVLTLSASAEYQKIIKNYASIRIIHVPFGRIFRKFPFIWIFLITYNFLGLNKFLKEFDALNPHNYPTQWLCHGFKEKTIWMCNEPPMTYFSLKGNAIGMKIRNTLKKIFYALLEASYTKESVGTVAVLDKKRFELVRKLYGISPKIVYSGVDIDKFRPLETKGRKAKILFVSRLAPHKRVIDFLKAAEIVSKNHPDAEFCVVGDGPDEKLVIDYKKNINGLIHLKNIPGDELARLYGESHILVFPAINQPWGLVPFEAMACKCAVLVSSDTGAAEVLENGKTAFVINPCDPEGIANKINYLLNNKKEMDKISENGYMFVEKNLSIDKYGERMESLLKEVSA